MRSTTRGVLVVLGLVAVDAALAVAGPRPATEPAATVRGASDDTAVALVDQWEVAQRTLGLVDDRHAERAADQRQRIRALYKLERAGAARLWFDPGERRELARRRLAAVHVLARDRRELALLDDERGRAAAAALLLGVESLAAFVTDGLAPPPPAPRSLQRPVAGAAIAVDFGTDRVAGLAVSRRGVELTAGAGKNVRAVDAGTVRFAGPLAGLGNAVVVGHAGYVTLLARLARLEVAPGDAVARGQILGEAAGDRVYLELRLDRPGGGNPIDPAPLLAP